MRRFVFVGEDSSRKSNHASKFWEIGRKGSALTIRFGPIGANGQTTLKEFASPDEAKKAEEKSIAEKLKKGYVEGLSAQKKPAKPRPSAATKSKPEKPASVSSAASVSVAEKAEPGLTAKAAPAFCTHCRATPMSSASDCTQSCGQHTGVRLSHARPPQRSRRACTPRSHQSLHT